MQLITILSPTGVTRTYNIHNSTQEVYVFQNGLQVGSQTHVINVEESNNGRDPILTLTCGTRIRFYARDEWDQLNDTPTSPQQ
jgi:hypothetical protein